MGPVQLPSAPEDNAKKLAALLQLRPPGRELVVRVNRLFWSDGEQGIRAFLDKVHNYTANGFDVELQVRYHPASGDVGNIPAWLAYVRHVVDVFGADPGVVAMTITNEVNLSQSANTSDGAFAGAKDALIQGIEAARAEARARRYWQLHFGFTYAYRGDPFSDQAFWSYLGQHGGSEFAAALDWVGLDFYPGSFYPPTILPTSSYRNETAIALALLRKCWFAQAQIGAEVPIWVTENGVPTDATPGSEDRQLAALRELVTAIHDYGATYNVTDYRYFNLRDNNSSGLNGLFSTAGLLRDDYTPKLAFAGYRELISQLGEAVPQPPPAPKSQPLCKVPKLKGKKLKKAKRRLKADDCRLGKVKGPKTGRVKKQKPRPRTVLPAGSKVRVKLG